MTEKATRIELPPQLLQGLLAGPQPAAKPPEVVECMTTEGGRMCFNVDAIELVSEGGAHEKEDRCYLRLKGLKDCVGVEISYDQFLKAIDVKPRILADAETDPRS